jgi:signal transduction histidine kinase
MTDTEMQAVKSELLPDRIPVLVVDDDQSVLDVTRLVLSRYRFDGHSVECITCNAASEARALLQQRNDIAVILLDVVMERDDAGLALVEFIRNTLGDRRLRIILRTGQAGFAPEYRVVQNYDINDYLAKTESTQERLFVSLTTALRGYRDIMMADFHARRAKEAEQEREVAARALEAKTQFIAHMSHEIRNPLTGVLGIVDLLEIQDDPQAIKPLLRDLNYTVQTLLGVVDDVLDVAKIEAGKLRLYPQVFNVRNWLERAAAIFSANLQRKDIRFSAEVAESVPEHLLGDASRMQQILVNFLSNACKFTPRGGRVSVRLTGEVRHHRYDLCLTVRDTGIGIEASRLQEVFKPFEQASDSTSSEFGGTGLGLSLCRNLAELMGGDVGVMSSPASGSTFWLEVPLDLVGEGYAPEESTTTSALNVVVCEDDAMNQKLLAVLLRKRGMAVSVFENGQDMLDSEAWKSADIFLMDCHMPVLNGMQTTRELRALGCRQPILALTAGVSDSERQQCLDAGMDSVIAKPVDFKLLHEQLLAHSRHGRHPVRVGS